MLRQLPKQRTFLLVLVHTAIFYFAYEIAMQLRWDLAVPRSERDLFLKTLPWALLLKVVVFHQFGSFHGWWRYVTFSDLAALLRAATISSLALYLIDWIAFPDFQVSRAVVILDWGVSIVLVGGFRSTWRILHEHVFPALRKHQRKPTLLIGAGDQGAALARQIHSNPKLDYHIVGFLGKEEAHFGTSLGGIPFLNHSDHAVEIAIQRNIHDILLLSQSIPGTQLRKLMDECRAANIHLKIIPRLESMLERSFRVAIRDVDINDLLRRDAVQLDASPITAMLQGRRVMVTGAGGSIGSEICRQLVKQQPESLILVERFENNLFYIDRELSAHSHGVTIVPCVADIRDKSRMATLFEQHRPQIVFHAAAHKHVPLMELNPGEAIKNNVLGTMALVDMAEKYETERFVMISTDKAVNPTSVMGVTKQLAERYVHACSETSDTKFVVVRFGNVLASAGSVVPIFQEQIRRGGPVTVTHPDMERYFMTIPEASQLVIQAAAMGHGGEIFVLDMGEPVKILQLAQDMIRLSGFAPEDIEIAFTGVRPGEKMYEELYLDDEQHLPTSHPKVKAAYHRAYSRGEVQASIEELAQCVNQEVDAIREVLKRVAPEYLAPGVSAVEPAESTN